MSYTREITIWCDGQGCDCFDMPAGNVRTVAESRAEVSKWGWTSKGGKDFCPLCSSEYREKQLVGGFKVWPGGMESSSEIVARFVERHRR